MENFYMDKLMGAAGIIVPIYNCQNYLRECLESIKSQSFVDFVVLLVDDGSIDRSAEICKEFCNSDSRFIYYYQENKGVSSARNYGLKYFLERALVKRICFIDSDDIVHRDYISILYNLMDEYHVQMACCGVKQFFTINDLQFEPTDTQTVQCYDSPYNFNVVPSMIWQRMFDIDLLNDKSLGPLYFNESLKYAEDILFSTELFIRVNKIVVTNEALYYYRKNPNSAIALSSINDRCKTEAQVYFYLRDKYRTKDPNTTKMIRQRKSFSVYGWMAYNSLISIMFRRGELIGKKQLEMVLPYMRRDIFRTFFLYGILIKEKFKYIFMCCFPKTYLKFLSDKINR